jgi:hypothetical protein
LHVQVRQELIQTRDVLNRSGERTQQTVNAIQECTRLIEEFENRLNRMSVHVYAGQSAAVGTNVARTPSGRAAVAAPPSPRLNPRRA